MTVSVTRRDGGTDKYMRFGDAYTKHHDGSHDVFRGGARTPFSYACGEWSDVEGDQRRSKGRFLGSIVLPGLTSVPHQFRWPSASTSTPSGADTLGGTGSSW